MYAQIIVLKKLRGSLTMERKTQASINLDFYLKFVIGSTKK